MTHYKKLERQERRNRSGRKVYPCPVCGRRNVLTEKDLRLGHPCGRCNGVQVRRMG